MQTPIRNKEGYECQDINKAELFILIKDSAFVHVNEVAHEILVNTKLKQKADITILRECAIYQKKQIYTRIIIRSHLLLFGLSIQSQLCVCQ